jgi:hypothetical protein
VEKQPQIIERIIEKDPKFIKEAPDYNNIPEEIILKEIRKRQVSASEQRQNRKKENGYCIKHYLNHNINL